jgi:hypothetical protein
MTKKIFIEDFAKGEGDNDWQKYTLKKECIIFGKTFTEEPMGLSIHKKQSLEDSIVKINEYINWLGNNCKNELINAQSEHINSFSSITVEELIEKNWYETLELLFVLLIVAESGNIGAYITCSDNYDEGHILDIELMGKKIIYMGYDG